MSTDILEVCSFNLRVNYGLSIAQAIEMGNYDWVEDVVAPEYFQEESVQVTGLLEVSIFGFSQTRYSAEVISVIKERGYRPGSTLEILNLGVENGELQRRLRVVALGAISTRNGLSRAVCLSGSVAKRYITAYLYDYQWSKSVCFMCIKTS